ncbi:Uncharacterized protein PECH_006812 [Penicillium ucsense]|uniref:Uncharacterized protein n=1 Tax=Penicillium ucsense TaxID=2839758 RepID=A0A8J8W2K4_9EURO|nr:Uncharacterized protein PECM_005160 [Penicillium ucsense]KAF7735298.1 Uncharacterized protein PECH_006812 [Penicillium ucsense]
MIASNLHINPIEPLSASRVNFKYHQLTSSRLHLLPSQQRYPYPISSIKSITTYHLPSTPPQHPLLTNTTSPKTTNMDSPNPNRPPPSQSRSSPSPSSFPSLAQTLTYLSTPLTSLVHILTGLPHPDFPSCILAFHLLTVPQLDRLAVYYHQVWPPTPETGLYPVVMRAWVGRVYGDGEGAADIGIEEKRKRFGGFIGLYEEEGVCLGVGREEEEEEEEEEDAMDLDKDEDDLMVEYHRECLRGNIDPDSELGLWIRDMLRGAFGKKRVRKEEVERKRREREAAAAEEEVLAWMAREWEDVLDEMMRESRGPFVKY